MADAHEEVLGLKNYQNVKIHSLNEVYCLDSIDKVPVMNEDFILVIDEVACFV